MKKELFLETEKEKKYKNIYKNIDNDGLLSIMKDFYIKKGSIPVLRDFKLRNGLPSSSLYISRFGSFQNALLLSNIEVPENKQWLFKREKYSKSELLESLKRETDKKLENNIYLLTNDEIDSIKEMASCSTYVHNFGGVVEAYKHIGIDYYEFNKIALENDMKEKYFIVKELLGRTPISRDLDKYSKLGIGYCMNSYENHFGSLAELQKIMGDQPTKLGQHISEDEMIEGLQILGEKLGRVPLQRDVEKCKWLPSVAHYARCFDNFSEAIKLAGFSDYKANNGKFYLTPKGNRALSIYEYDFLIMLENSDLEFDKEEYYSKYIEGFKRRLRFDFTLKYDNKNYLIEIFGMMDLEWYREKAKYKLDLCKQYNLPIIDLYPSDLNGKSSAELYRLVINKIEILKESA